MSQNQVFKTRLLNSLTKVFADEELNGISIKSGSMLSNEVYSFQVAYCWSEYMIKNVKVRVNSDLAPWITIRRVGLVPSEMPCYFDHDENILRNTPGFYPDPLMPLDDEGLALLPNQWRAVWVTVDTKGEAKPGNYKIDIVFEDKEGKKLGEEEFEIEIINAALPKQSLIHTEWFHTDCLSTWYKVDVFSEKHWEIIEKYICAAASHGINMILTPLFTPPLDTQVGGERPTVQLVDVKIGGDKYKFGFEKLERWVDICKRNGIEYFEFSHLFTQWGAKNAPKIIAEEDGKLKQIFGWDTDAAGEEYKAFLDQFLPELINFIENHGLKNSSYFHVSDEPFLEHMESYKSASNIMRKYLGDFPIIDALSDYKFYEMGLVKNPIPSTNHIDDFLENNVPNLWTYYCCAQYNKVANRFFNMPSARNRIIGMQLYKFNIKGFLQWGYNFWYSQYSIYPIDPFKVTDAACAFPSGDAFVVYPGEDGPIDSLRFEVFYEALQDLRALNMLESYIGREAVLNMLEEGLENPITFSEYPIDSEWIITKREQINRKIAEHI